MKKNILYIALLGFVSLMTVSCNKELDIEKHGNMGSMETYYTTDENIMTGTASLYLEVKSAYYNWLFVKNLLSDDVWCGGGQRGDNGEMEKLNEYRFDSNHSMIESLYKGCYAIIYKANLLIDKTDSESAVAKRAINEAKVFRAFGHFELVTLFGTAPVVDHLLTPDEYQQSNSTPAELWAIVEKDLTEAINSGTLPSKSGVNDAETGIRVTKEYAQALLGKAYLFQGKNSEAASMLDNVINSNKYALFPGEYDDQFHAVYNNNNCESLFELQKRNDHEQIWNTFDMIYIMQGWRTSVLSYSGQALSTLALGNYGFLNPRKSLYEAFVSWEGEDGYRKSKTIWNYDQMKAFGVEVQPGASVYGDEGYFFWKNQAYKSDCAADMSYFQVGQFIDLKVMRYSEVLLLAAEANLQANSNKALQYINMVRERAKETPLSSVSLNDIKMEKRLELCNEGVRFQDLVRWGDGKTAMGEQGKQVPAFTGSDVQWNWQNTVYGFQDKHNLLPIPLKELELNPNMEQNPGW